MKSAVKLLYGTSNPAKLDSMRKRLESLNLQIIGLNDLGKAIPVIEEDGSTPLENAEKKALGYYKAFGMPVFSCDSGLYIDGIPEEKQPGVHVRNIDGKCLTDDEMIEYYSTLAAEYGDLTARYWNAICLVADGQHIYRAMEESMASDPLLITKKPHRVRKKGFPLDSLSIDIKTGKYFYDLDEEEKTQGAVRDGFLDFFQKIMPL